MRGTGMGRSGFYSIPKGDLSGILVERDIVFKQSFSCFPGQIWIHYCNSHYVDNFFCAVLAQWKAGCGRSCLRLYFRPRHVPVNYSSKTLPWVRLASWLYNGGEQNSKQLKSYSFVKSWRGNDSNRLLAFIPWHENVCLAREGEVGSSGLGTPA